MFTVDLLDVDIRWAVALVIIMKFVAVLVDHIAI